MDRRLSIGSVRPRSRGRRWAQDWGACQLSTTSFRVLSVTFLAVALILLSMNQVSSGLCLHHYVDVPRAWNTQPSREAPTVQIAPNVIRHSGVVVGYTADIVSAKPDALQRLEDVLRTSRDLCRQLGGDCQGVLNFEVDRKIETRVLKAVLASALRTGYRHHDFVTERWVAMADALDQNISTQQERTGP